jgi:hypothetical protein
MKHKVATLDGELLDDAVAKAEGVERSRAVYMRSCPSSVWEDGGPIIERERICLEWRQPDSDAFAMAWVANGLSDEAWGVDRTPWQGPTPLIAAMRAYVASKFGEEVELP